MSDDDCRSVLAPYFHRFKDEDSGCRIESGGSFVCEVMSASHRTPEEHSSDRRGEREERRA